MSSPEISVYGIFILIKHLIIMFFWHTDHLENKPSYSFQKQCYQKTRDLEIWNSRNEFSASCLLVPVKPKHLPCDSLFASVS